MQLTLQFGFGLHRCMGNRLAVMQLRIVWEETLRRFDRVEGESTIRIDPQESLWNPIKLRSVTLKPVTLD